MSEQGFPPYVKFKRAISQFLERTDKKVEDLDVILFINMRRIYEAPPKNYERAMRILSACDKINRGLDECSEVN